VFISESNKESFLMETITLALMPLYSKLKSKQCKKQPFGSILKVLEMKQSQFTVTARLAWQH
jgi:hypothetical protein